MRGAAAVPFLALALILVAPEVPAQSDAGAGRRLIEAHPPRSERTPDGVPKRLGAEDPAGGDPTEVLEEVSRNLEISRETIRTSRVSVATANIRLQVLRGRVQRELERVRLARERTRTPSYESGSERQPEEDGPRIDVPVWDDRA